MMQKYKSTRLAAPLIRLNNKEISSGLVYFTSNAISLWSDHLGGLVADLEDWTWHEDATSGTTLYIVTDINA